MPSHVCGNTNAAAGPHRLRRVLCPVRLSVHLWHERERDVPTSPTSRRTPPASSWLSSQSCRSALTPTWSRPTGGARRNGHREHVGGPCPSRLIWILTDLAADTRRTHRGRRGQASSWSVDLGPHGSCGRRPPDPSSYRRMRCLEGPALGESTLRVFDVCVCPIAALRAPGAMLRR